MKKFSKILTVILSSLLVLFSFINFTKAEQLNSRVFGKAKVIMVFPTNLENVEGSEEDKKLLAASGWTESLDGYIREYPLEETEFTINETKYKTDNNGHFDIELKSGDQYEMKINHPSFEGHTIKIDTSEENVHLNPIVKINFLTFMDTSPEETDVEDDTKNPIASRASGPRTGGFNGEKITKHDGHNDATYKKNSYVTCNRFNGWLGDQKYYDKSSHKVKSGINFSWSDCDWAVGDFASPCLSTTKGDYAKDPKKRYCKSFSLSISGSSTCSIDIGHKALYHEHTKSKSPTGY